MRNIKLYFLFLLISVFLISSIATAGSIKNPDTFIHATENSVEAVDLHFMTSSATTELSSNVYDSLLANGEDGKLKPSLAALVPTKNNKLIRVKEDGTTLIEFPIREGVTFHNGDLLIPEDVKYTMERGIIVGKLSTLCNNLLGESSFKKLAERVGYDKAYEKLDQSIVVKGNSVVFKLPEPFAPFLDMMADKGASFGILNKDWCIEQGGWPGTPETVKDYTSLKLEDDALNENMMGTGPFKFVSWKPEERIVFERFDDYWQGPAKIKRVIRKIVPDTNTQLMLLKKGDVDFVEVGVSTLQQIEGQEGVKVVKDIPTSWLLKINFNFDIKSNKYLGSAKLAADGIPGDFFSDINVRKAFEYTFDYNTFIEDVLLGKAIKPYGPVLAGFPTANPDNPQYKHNLQKAEEHFKKAWDGKLWETGFTMTVPYCGKNRQRAFEIIKQNLKKINPKFKLKLNSLPWAAYVGAINDSKLPMSVFGILPRRKHPYFSISYHMHSKDFYAPINGYAELAEKKYDPLIEKLGKTYDKDKMREISYKLQRLSYEDALSIFHHQAVGQVAMREWVNGYQPSPFPFLVDFYSIYKE